MLRWLELKVPPPLVVVIAAAAMWFANRVIGGNVSFGFWFFAGVIVMGVGFGLAVTGLRTLIANRTTPSPIQIERARTLVTSGLYQFTRNPMYLGMVIFLIGIAVILGSVALLAGPTLFIVYITQFQILPEERVMAQKFGADYTAYKNRVRRWI